MAEGLQTGWGRARAALALPFQAIVAARGHLLPFAAVAFGIGICLWFHWGYEPGRQDYSIAFGLMVLGGIGFWRAPDLMRPFAALLLAVTAGFLASGLRAHLVAAPMLDFRYYGPVEGRVVEIDRSASDALRLTLDRVVLERMAPARTPARVRISLHGADVWHQAEPGQIVILTAHLAAPEGPVEPGGFDFRRMAFFDRLGAVGYSRTPVLLLEPARPGEEWIARLRSWFSAGIRAHIPGEAGAFAAGAMTGDRSGISQATVEALRDSSLAHILAISGMNLAFLASFVFALIRGAVALVPPVALRLDARKISAAASLGVAWFYLMLSGANVATERAFYMLAIMLLAVLLDRRAITLRSAALAALLLLAMQPESLLEPGFQMSFAATVALIAGFQALDRRFMAAGRWPAWAVMGFTLVASSVIGGFATAPFAAAHFNRFADYGLLANLLTVPAMGIAIMPMGVLAFLLAPFGLEGLPLWVMGLGAEWILFIAYRIAALDGAVTGIPTPAPAALAIISLAGLWLILWPGRARLGGIAGIVMGLALWPMAPRPGLLITADGRLLGLIGPEGRALSLPKGGGFAARNWLENDGDLTDQAKAAERSGFDGPRAARRFSFAGVKGVALSGKAGMALLPEACGAYAIIILAGPSPVDALPQGCAVLDESVLRRSGALAFTHSAAGIEVRVAYEGGRIWQPTPPDLLVLARALPADVQISGQNQLIAAVKAANPPRPQGTSSKNHALGEMAPRLAEIAVDALGPTPIMRGP